MTRAEALGRLSILAERLGMGLAHSTDHGHTGRIVLWVANRARSDSDRARAGELIDHLEPGDVRGLIGDEIADFGFGRLWEMNREQRHPAGSGTKEDGMSTTKAEAVARLESVAGCLALARRELQAVADTPIATGGEAAVLRDGAETAAGDVQRVLDDLKNVLASTK